MHQSRVDGDNRLGRFALFSKLDGGFEQLSQPPATSTNITGAEISFFCPDTILTAPVCAQAAKYSYCAFC